MKNLLSIFVSLSFSFLLNAQQKAVTELGEEVILFKDGTWKYTNQDYLKKTDIPTNNTIFKKNEKASFLLKSSKVDVGFWLNPKKWSFNKGIRNSEAEYELKLKEGDLYGMIITEKIEIPLETLKKIALENGRLVAPDLKIIKEEYRTVNNSKVLLLQLQGTTQNIKFSYYGYYSSNSSGTVQFICYTSQNLLENYLDECQELLNGFITL